MPRAKNYRATKVITKRVLEVCLITKIINSLKFIASTISSIVSMEIKEAIIIIPSQIKTAGGSEEEVEVTGETREAADMITEELASG